MSDTVIAQKDFYTQAPLPSPAVFDKLARFEHITFVGDISTVEISDDGATYFDVTASVNTATAGVVVTSNVSAKFWRVTASGSVSVMAH